MISAGPALDRFDADLADGLLTLVGADQSEVDAGALAIVRSHGLRAMDALHLSMARSVLPELAGPRRLDDVCDRRRPPGRSG